MSRSKVCGKGNRACLRNLRGLDPNLDREDIGAMIVLKVGIPLDPVTTIHPSLGIDPQAYFVIPDSIAGNRNLNFLNKGFIKRLVIGVLPSNKMRSTPN